MEVIIKEYLVLVIESVINCNNEASREHISIFIVIRDGLKVGNKRIKDYPLTTGAAAKFRE